MKKVFLITFIISLLTVISITFFIQKACSGDEVVKESHQDDFKLTLYSEKCNYKRDDALLIWSTITYTGEQKPVVVAHGDPIITYGIFDAAGEIVFDGVTLLKGMTSELPLEKTYLFHHHRNEYLPPGRYTIRADADFEHHGSRYNISAEFKIIFN